jgi:hypothetical protein
MYCAPSHSTCRHVGSVWARADCFPHIGKRCRCHQASDFSAAVRIADTLVKSNPADAQVRYWRGNAYEKLKDFSHALTDYINTIQLLGEPNRVAIDNFYDVSRMYAALNRLCDAITPIETFISFDPANRRTTQSTQLIMAYP